jgi:hypothetical protein
VAVLNQTVPGVPTGQGCMRIVGSTLNTAFRQIVPTLADIGTFREVTPPMHNDFA